MNFNVLCAALGRKSAFGLKQTIAAVVLLLGSGGLIWAATDEGSKLKQIALALAQAAQIARAPGVHSLNVDTYLLNNGFSQIEADDVVRFLPGFTMRRPLTLVYFAPDGTGAIRQFEGNGNRDQFKQISWWRSRMGICYQVGKQSDGPGRNCAIFYKIDSTIVMLGIDTYGIMEGPGKAHFIKGNHTNVTSWGAAMRLSN